MLELALENAGQMTGSHIFHQEEGSTMHVGPTVSGGGIFHTWEYSPNPQTGLHRRLPALGKAQREASGGDLGCRASIPAAQVI